MYIRIFQPHPPGSDPPPQIVVHIGFARQEATRFVRAAALTMAAKRPVDFFGS
jgi:hypothetical protein